MAALIVPEFSEGECVVAAVVTNRGERQLAPAQVGAAQVGAMQVGAARFAQG